MPARRCPSCAKERIPVAELLANDTRCPSCGRCIGIHRFYSTFFYLLILAVTLVSTFAVFLQFGVFAAILWAPFPIGAIGYIKARYSPLVVRPTSVGG